MLVIVFFFLLGKYWRKLYDNHVSVECNEHSKYYNSKVYNAFVHVYYNALVCCSPFCLIKKIILTCAFKRDPRFHVYAIQLYLLMHFMDTFNKYTKHYVYIYICKYTHKLEIPNGFSSSFILLIIFLRITYICNSNEGLCFGNNTFDASY